MENTVGKVEIARYEQFLLFPQCFQKASFPEASKGVVVWEWVNRAKNMVGKGENVSHQHLLLFPHNVFGRNFPQGRQNRHLLEKGYIYDV